MTIERAIHEQWAGNRPLSALVPPERLYTGLPPIRDAAQQPIGFPYVALAVEGESFVTRTSSGTLLTTERIRRATNLSLEVVTDADAGRITPESKGLEELYRSLEQACDRLRHVLKSREPDRYVTTRS